MDPSSDLSAFYALLRRLEGSPFQGLSLAELLRSRRLPKRGVYFFRERGEVRASLPESSRVVRVGTHAVTDTSKSKLSNRLRAHLGTSSGSGNHRGSIFRLHVGAAMLRRDLSTVETWGVGSIKPASLRQSPEMQAAEMALEKRVSEYIGAMSVLWLDVDDEPSPNCLRAVIERNAIALLSNRLSPIDPSSTQWLGRYSARDVINRSGLWNVRHVDDAYDREFLGLLEDAVDQTVRRCTI